MPDRGMCIGFVSGKGGTGKTSVLAGTGAALARLGRRTLCMDCCPGLRNLDLVMGLSEQSLMDFSDVIAGRCTLEEAVVEYPGKPGLFLLNAPADAGEHVTPLQMQTLSGHIRSTFDVCLMDAPSDMGDGFTNVVSASDWVIVVTTPHPCARRNAQRVVMELSAFPPGDVRLIVNRVRRTPFHAAETNIDDIMNQTGLPLLGLVPEDSAFNRGLPVTLAPPHCAAAQACSRIAQRIQGEPVPLPRFFR